MLGDSVSQVENLMVIELQINPDESIGDYISRIWPMVLMNKPTIVYSNTGSRAQAQLLLAYKAKYDHGMVLRLSYDSVKVVTAYKLINGEWTTA